MTTEAKTLPAIAPAPQRAAPVESPLTLMWYKFRAHKLAVWSIWTIGALYLMAIFANWVAPYDPETRFGLPFAAPTLPTVMVDGRFVKVQVTRSPGSR